MFETLGVWDVVADGAQPILDMVVTDSKLKDAVRPVFLTFAGEVEPGQPFAHMIENAPLVAALAARARAQGIVLRATAVTGFEQRPGRVVVAFGDGGVTQAALLVAADGARSRVREQAGIATHGVPLIRDGLYAHHRDLGGALYLYFDDPGAAREACALLTRTAGIDEVVPNAEAHRDHLPPERVGDLICWAAQDVALGVWADGPVSRSESGLRSHGSKHEQRIPMLVAGPGVRAGVEIRGGRTIDLMPTLCRLTGLDAGPVDGRVLEDVLA